MDARARPTGERRLTVYRVGERLLLSEVLPVLQNMGVDVVDERPYEIDRIGARRPGSTTSASPSRRSSCRCCARCPSGSPRRSRAVWRGEAEDDGLGALVLLAGLNWRQVTVVRAYVQWLRQAGLPFGQDYVEQTLAAHPDIVARLVRAVRDAVLPRPQHGRAERQEELVESLRRAIGEVESLDADRVLSSLLAAVTATQRTTLLRRVAAAPWRSSSTRPACPTCPSRGRPARCGSARRG